MVHVLRWAGHRYIVKGGMQKNVEGYNITLIPVASVEMLMASVFSTIASLRAKYGY